MADMRIVPSEDFPLNVFLMKIADQLTSEEFETLKFYCSGKDGFKKGILEQMKNCRSLFTHMKEMRMLSNYNLVTLQAMIWHLNRKDLYKMFVEFCQNQDESLHFFVPSDTPVNGFKYIDFHIRGTKGLNDLNRLRSELCILLRCPPENIIIDGLRPTSSIYITLMIPDCCVEYLMDIDELQKSVFYSLGVDRYKINEMFVDCTVFHCGDNVPNFEPNAAVDEILQTKKRFEIDLERYQIDYSQVNDEKDRLQQQLESFQDKIIDCTREWKYSKDMCDEKVSFLEKAKNEYQLMCWQLSSDLYNCQKDLQTCKTALEEKGTQITLLYSRKDGGINQLSRSLSQESLKELGERSCKIQSKIIEILQSSRACEITSSIIRQVHKFRNDIDMLKDTVQNMVNKEKFDDVYTAVLNLKSIEDKIAERRREIRATDETVGYSYTTEGLQDSDSDDSEVSDDE